MYICEDCKSGFEEAAIYKETHGFHDGSCEEFAICPSCKSNHVHQEETYKGYTQDAVQNLFSLELGLKYIEQFNLEAEYFPYAKHIGLDTERYEEQEIKLLLPVLKQIFQLRIEQDSLFCPAKDFIEDLMHFCMEDWTHFTDFFLGQSGKEETVQKVG